MAKDKLQEAINGYMITDDEASRLEEAKKIANEVQDNKLIPFIELLGDQITSDNDAVRGIAMRCLTDTVTFMNELPRGDIEVLVTFFLQRLDDNASLESALRGLAVLVAQRGFSKGSSAEVLGELERINIRSRSQVERHQVFLILESLVRFNNRGFVKTFVLLASGEKDPQNLLTSLNISRSLLETRELAPEEQEDIFDVTFCYFPVTFKPPKDMPYNISADTIRLNLRKTLSSPQLAKNVVSGLISKLAAVDLGIKEDTLLTLLSLSESLARAGALELYWQEIWDGVKYEILHGTPDAPLYANSMDVLQSLLPVGPDFIVAVKSEYDLLDNPKLAPALAHLILGLTRAGDAALFGDLAEAAVAKLIDGKSIEETLQTVPVFWTLLQAPFLIPREDDVFSILMRAANSDTEHRMTAIQALANLASKNAEYGPTITQALTEMLSDSTLHEAAVLASAKLAKSGSKLTESITFPALFAKLESSTSEGATSEVLSTLAELSVTKELVYTLTRRLISKIPKVRDTNVLFGIMDTIFQSTRNLQQDELVGYDKAVFPLLDLVAAGSSTAELLAESDVTLDRLGQILELTSRAVPPSRAGDYSSKVSDLFVAKLDMLKTGPTPMFGLFVASVAGLQDAPPALSSLNVVTLANLLAGTTSVFVRSNYLRLLALVSNKWPELFGDLSAVLEGLKSLIGEAKSDANSLEVTAWIGKGLLYRADKLGYVVSDYIVSLLNDATLGRLAARAFGALVVEDRLLVKENRIVLRRLFHQRLFLQTVDHLIAGVGSDSKLNYLVALGSLLKTTPIGVINTASKRIVPILFESLLVEIPQVNLAAIKTLTAVLPSNADLVDHKSGEKLFVKLLDLAGNTSTTAVVRSSAVEALVTLAGSLPRELGAAMAPRLRSGLVPVLGDRSRDVRRAAINARQFFYDF